MRRLVSAFFLFAAALVVSAGPVPFSFWKTSGGGGGGTSYRYYRLYIGGGEIGSYGANIREMELFTATTAPDYLTSNGTDLTNGLGGSAFSSGAVAGSAANVFDNDTGTEWNCAVGTGIYIGIDLGTAQSARSANVRVGDYYVSTTIELQGSNDNSSYTTLASITTPSSNTTYQLAW